MLYSILFLSSDLFIAKLSLISSSSGLSSSFFFNVCAFFFLCTKTFVDICFHSFLSLSSQRLSHDVKQSGVLKRDENEAIFSLSWCTMRRLKHKANDKLLLFLCVRRIFLFLYFYPCLLTVNSIKSDITMLVAAFFSEIVMKQIFKKSLFFLYEAVIPTSSEILTTDIHLNKMADGKSYWDLIKSFFLNYEA